MSEEVYIPTPPFEPNKEHVVRSIKIDDGALYFYKCTPVRVIDGDSVVLDIDLGLRTWVRHSVRLNDIDAPERRGEDKEMGQRSTEFLRWLLSGPHEFICHTIKTGKYGRYLVDLFVDFNCVNDIMVNEGYAKIYGQDV
tara:strand:- start:21455 stop:21871 length:417 start_codon:yes stop_codon:yes gene_type:complete